MNRRVLACLLFLALVVGTIPMIPQSAQAYEDIDECLADGHGLIYCVWDAISCRFLSDCEGDYPW